MMYLKLKTAIVFILLIVGVTSAMFIIEQKPKKKTTTDLEKREMTYYKDSLEAEYYKQKLSQ